eukprot:9684010-Prorocentrum_lima.AAC.1
MTLVIGGTRTHSPGVVCCLRGCRMERRPSSTSVEGLSEAPSRKVPKGVVALQVTPLLEIEESWVE